MSILLARQPIFNRVMEVYGYELLHRKSMNNYYESADDDIATAELVNDTFLTMSLNDIASGKKAFINFSADLVIEGVPLLLPKEEIIIELENRTDYSTELINACKKTSSLGYTIALDNYNPINFNKQMFSIANIIKVNFKSIPFEQHLQLVKGNNEKIFAAEKIETRQEYEAAHALGYHLFQGYFFSKPVISAINEHLQFNSNLVRLVNEIEKYQFDYQKGAAIIERDVGLSYKLLRVANSIQYGAQHEVYSIKQALSRLGLDGTKKWLYLMMLQSIQIKETSELIYTSLIRAKFMELLSKKGELHNKHLELFMVGLFSALDIIMNKPMQECMEGVLLTDSVKNALIGENNELRYILEYTLLIERGEWAAVEKKDTLLPLPQMMSIYFAAIKWTKEINY